ncbi:Pyruvate-flavodoxin oxidoreductase [Lactococcus cremoris]|uniref:Pyruvate:ferredoxin (Flavodoxin) oxidoreductase n=1 Tax=Lactococcus lactis subsp. cremoris TaxID=1359 RepID=A0A1V0PJ10_LACLC|nr:pyruvate:ferredoxin (flavodoxin) oxidoreductase [Lactococcus cremoris]ARE29251.1 pyruvate:ferredoxin (flavodoxin) oxidoreductase [Lactococcus cremoris]EUN34314.1 pyruvate:ferredoxin (flavodoxin) oxidoreductase [Lactococcus cremoris subsp. cremoris HP]KZK05312.1 Pyruvate-flavodoxin oxidoreductase [Lactococcus cremoris]KZK42097.1 Pyruvate-flavodoxin oxidoreductase [Lactococcus cremoris]KZK44451.1 Pyruvate-flavodoxin oxidoreductase [Lactococcus cremoris]
MKKTMDGNMAAAHIAYAFSEIAVIYPITPSSPMADYTDAWSVAGRKNIWGQRVKITELQSEAGAAGAMHGVLKAGGLATTYTASQGLLLLLPNMYKMAGELLPAVIHVAARAVAAGALNIFGDQSDVMSARTTGFAMLAESSVQEVMDLSAVAHLATLEGSVPFLNFFDGFRTSHEIQKIDVINYQDLLPMVNQEKLADFRARAMNPDHPTVSGINQNADIYFQQRETVNAYYEALPEIVQKYMGKINELRGTDYDLVNYYGAPDATEVIVSMGSVAGTIEQTVDYLNAQGRKVGFLNIHLYRPFPMENFLEKLPKTVTSVAVLDRTKEAGSNGEPLFLDVQSALFNSNVKEVIGGRYGIGGKDTRPEHIVSIFDELLKENPKRIFTIGITDDVTNLSLENLSVLDLTPSDTFQAKFWGFGSDGTVGANKAAIKIIGDHTDKYVQAAFEYDSKKSGGLTISHLRFGDSPINSEYMTATLEFVACHNMTYVRKYNLTKGLKAGGVFLLNTSWDLEHLSKNLPNEMKRYIAENNIRFYTIDAMKIAHETGMERRINTIMQVAFFKLAHVMPFDEAYEILKKDAQKYAKKSPTIVEQNLKAMALALNGLHEVIVPEGWAETTENVIEAVTKETARKKYVFEIVNKTNAFEGDELSVQTLVDNGMTFGDEPLGTTASEKRGIALEIPEWNAQACIQCNECSFVCPHAAIRPFLVDEDEWNQAPEGFHVMDYKGSDGLKYRIQVSVEDCTGCGLCVEACPKKGEALKMIPYEGQEKESVNWAFAQTLKTKENPARPGTIVASQFEKPLFEFSGACSGCGETPYIKLLTQMFGDRMMISNATGCSAIYGGTQATPYTTNEQEQGPAWSNSLFEDNAEYGYGMWLASQTRRQKLAAEVLEALPEMSAELQNLAKDWLEHLEDSEGTRARAEKMKGMLASEHFNSPKLDAIYKQKDQFVKPTQWIFGGDGWAYDIGFGGLDHIVASGADVNILVMDNEVYANTGGQVSKATPASAIAQFAAGGKSSTKKDLGAMLMTYGEVYVAQIASGANMMQTIRAFDEAEKFKGPSVIIAYTPCISHGLYGGIHLALDEAKEAVNSGYWQLYRYNPLLEDLGENPMILDFKKPDFGKVRDFLLTQSRFGNLLKVDAEHAENLYDKAAKDSRKRFMRYARLSGDLDKFLEREAKALAKKNADLGISTETNLKKERKTRPVDPEREARRAARKAERAAKK